MVIQCLDKLIDYIYTHPSLIPIIFLIIKTATVTLFASTFEKPEDLTKTLEGSGYNIAFISVTLYSQVVKNPQKLISQTKYLVESCFGLGIILVCLFIGSYFCFGYQRKIKNERTPLKIFGWELKRNAKIILRILLCVISLVLGVYGFVVVTQYIV